MWLGVASLMFVIVSLSLVLPLRWINPPTSMFMLLDDSGIEPLDHHWVPWPELGEILIVSTPRRTSSHTAISPPSTTC